MLVLAIHNLAAISAKVPMCCIALKDFHKRGALPPHLKLRQIVPTSGLQSTSLWDVSTVEELQEWLEENLMDDATHTCHVVQEEFAFGIAMELSKYDSVSAGWMCVGRKPVLQKGAY